MMMMNGYDESVKKQTEKHSSTSITKQKKKIFK